MNELLNHLAYQYERHLRALKQNEVDNKIILEFIEMYGGNEDTELSSWLDTIGKCQSH